MKIEKLITNDTFNIKESLKKIIGSSDDAWKVLSGGDVGRIAELLKDCNIKNISSDIICTFVEALNLQQTEITVSIDGDSGKYKAVNMFRQGIRVLDHSDPSFFGIK